MNDWLTERLTVWLTDCWLTDWLYGLTDWLTDRLTDRLTDWLNEWLTEWLIQNGINEWPTSHIPLKLTNPCLRLKIYLFIFFKYLYLQAIINVKSGDSAVPTVYQSLTATRFLRIQPRSWYKESTLRIEVYGCLLSAAQTQGLVLGFVWNLTPSFCIIRFNCFFWFSLTSPRNIFYLCRESNFNESLFSFILNWLSVFNFWLTSKNIPFGAKTMLNSFKNEEAPNVHESEEA